jgi:hypothetical protein
MKKLNIFATLALGLLAFTSCDSDRDDNPVLNIPQSFNLLVPEIGDNAVNLKNSESVRFRAEAAPDYGFPTEVSYWIQMTDAADFNDPSKIVSTDTKGKSITYDAPANEIDLAVMKLRGYDTPEQVDENEVIDLKVRMVAMLANSTDSSSYVYSNVQTLKVNPYFLKESLPKFWYMTGGIIADGSWGNDPAFIGTRMTPMYVKAGESYNRFSGDGIIEYVGYFTTGEFKIIAPKGLVNWNFGMAGGDLASGGFAYRDGGDDPGNIKVTIAGYYRITINTAENSMQSEVYKPETPVKKYTSMKIGDQSLNVVTTVAENHDWYAELTFAAPADLKFTADDGTAWGTSAFPCGVGTNDGGAISVAAGTYKVYFNDITGAYTFVEQ